MKLFNMKSKSTSIIISLFIVIAILIFLTLSIISIATPNLSKEIAKDLNKGIQSLCVGDIHEYYNMYNTRKLTEIEKTKFYEKITETQEVVDSEMDLFKKYKLTIKINDVSIINKIGDNLFLCNINVNYKYRKSHDTTDTVDKTEDYIIKIIDVGNMDYKILLPFNSLDKDFSSSNLYKKLKDSNTQKQAEKIKKEREEQEKLENQQAEEQKDNLEENTNINDNFSSIDDTISTTETTEENNVTTEENDVTTEEPISNNTTNNTTNNTENTNNTNTENITNQGENKSSFESFLEE